MRKGQVIEVDFEPQVGAEIMKKRPAVIISNTQLNNLLPVITVVPLRGSLELALDFMHIVNFDSKNGLTKDSFADVCQVKSIDKGRIKGVLGMLSKNDLAEIISSLDFVFHDAA
ncbi:type II toxin-antitoxin system PemK/MazF family toxin [Fluviicola taffensis]|uniref:mRNA interferase n=1 Tax=Fluviicola taffensis (strain DSM 16823 / NCIMB 13979 / RW262) TaxID=755732 RepID=F2IHI7_FLUTR|nr:type II toxin-antitoxin system PemK/MazF family toxin [Fluviicola taffensis]AEA43752.1 transcriptional modulator of MazE/toxin, MazF [Fluviicola taffensis DSM 16823]